MTDHETFLATAKRVVKLEADALAVLAASLDESFSQAIELILQAKGRVIISGMGKSGHIARKIAATLASTGTPAHFVHPAEASHGDLGMVGRGDVALVLSNSGETPPATGPPLTPRWPQASSPLRLTLTSIRSVTVPQRGPRLATPRCPLVRPR